METGHVRVGASLSDHRGCKKIDSPGILTLGTHLHVAC